MCSILSVSLCIKLQPILVFKAPQQILSHTPYVVCLLLPDSAAACALMINLLLPFPHHITMYHELLFINQNLDGPHLSEAFPDLPLSPPVLYCCHCKQLNLNFCNQLLACSSSSLNLKTFPEMSHVSISVSLGIISFHEV